MKQMKRQGQQNSRCRESANAGFSLVELLIAVAILAIIVIPLLHMFITTTRINVKSRQTLRATTVAQDIMEGLKAYTVEEVVAQFEPPAGMSGATYHYPADGFYILNSSMIQGGVQDLTAAKAEYEGVYYFGIENLKLQGSEYDALIRLDASTYGEDKDKTTDSSGNPVNRKKAHDNKFNGRYYAEIGSVAEINGGGDEEAMKTDSSYHENKKLGEAVLENAKEQFGDQIMAAGETLPADWDDQWKNKELQDIVTKRKIEVELADGGDDKCKATINFTYNCSYTYNGNVYTCVSRGRDGSVGGKVLEDTPRTFTSGNFYLFYYPIYNSGPAIDEIYFKIKDTNKLCDEDQPLLKSIILAKQVRSDVDTSANVIAPELTEAELWTKESSYQAHVDISSDAAINGELLFRTNVDTNMVKDPSTGMREPIMGVTCTYDLSHVNQCSFAGDTASDKVTNVIYDVEITVYKTGAAPHFTDSQDNYDFESHDDVHKLATITSLSQ